MKYLSNYVEEEQTALFEKCGVFFAFSKKQFEEGCEKVGASTDNKIMSFGGGGYLLSKHYEEFESEMENIQKRGIERDIKENGLDAIIERELANHEVQIGGDWKQIIGVLEDYKGISVTMIYEGYKKFYQKCIDNDWF